MRTLDADAVAAATPWAALADVLERSAATSDAICPDRHVHPYEGAGSSTSSLLLMPAWTTDATGDGMVGVKVVTHVPENGDRGLPTINAAYLAFDRVTGAPVAMLDGDALTSRRTAAISALAGRLLARADSRSLTVVGTGQLCSPVVAAHTALGGFERVSIWGRDAARARSAALDASATTSVPVTAAEDLEQAVRGADVVVCVTGATAPLVLGRWLRPGTHVNLFGAFRPDMRESDDEVVRRATLFVDVPAAVTAGDLSQPIADGVIQPADIAGDLADLAAGRHPGRSQPGEITVFKSVGFAAADLAAARLALSR